MPRHEPVHRAATRTAYSNGATGRQTHETVLKATYDIHVSEGLEFQPDLQYILRPNAQANINDALVLGFKAHLRF